MGRGSEEQRYGMWSIDRPLPSGIKEELSTGALEAYLREAGVGGEGALKVARFAHGHANQSYLLEWSNCAAVLRRAPDGAPRQRESYVQREHAFLATVCQHYPKAPRPMHLCEDASILGAPFFVMQRVEGTIVRGTKPDLPGLDASVVDRMSRALVGELAALHSVSVPPDLVRSSVRGGGYVERQVQRWCETYDQGLRQLAIRDDAASDVIGWLQANLPARQSPVFVHNDFKFDNAVFDPGDPSRIVGILDWELATIGDPLMDLGTALAYWVEPAELDAVQGFPLGPTALRGSPSREELVRWYEEHVGRKVEAPLFYFVLALIKVSAISLLLFQQARRQGLHDDAWRHGRTAAHHFTSLAQRAIVEGRISSLAG